MKYTIMLIASALCFSSSSLFASQPMSLRGNTKITEEKEAKVVFMGVQSDKDKFRRTLHQAPMIPHPIDHYVITKAKNSCLVCHAKAKSQVSPEEIKKGAVFFSDTHLLNRDNEQKVLLDNRWYFCNQCHAIQHNTEKLQKK